MANLVQPSLKLSNYLQFLEKLSDKRANIHANIAQSMTEFRDNCSIGEIQQLVTEVLLMLKDWSKCQIDWLTCMVQVDMIDILLRVESISRRELNYSPAKAKAIRMIIHQLLPVTMLRHYKGGEIFHGCGEEFIINAWEVMIGKMETDAWDMGIITNQVYKISEAVKAHARTFHPRGCEPFCNDFRQIVALQEEWEKVTTTKKTFKM